LRIFLLITLLLVIGPVPAYAIDSPVTADEPKLRAAIVLGIFRFTTWPAGARDTGVFRVCTLGNPTSERDLKLISAQRQHHNLPIITEKITDSSGDISRCDVLLIGADIKSDSLIKILSTKNGFGVLTICDNCHIKNSKAMLKLVRKDNRIRFTVNLYQAKKKGIQFSSSLLELALKVKQD
jgi:hypothetical protein